MFEEWLGKILRVFLVEGPEVKELLDGFNAPLGTLHARIVACHSLGLIDNDECKEMQAIRKIRNKFAHQWDGVSFDLPAIRGMCVSLPWRGPPEYEHTSKARGRFNAAVALLLTDLMWREQLVAKERRKRKSWPNRAR
jgi:mannitol operon repressor